MSAIGPLVLLPLRAPMLLVLFLVSAYLGVSSTLGEAGARERIGDMAMLQWSAECLQALLVVVVCTVPHVLLRQLSSLMASSRVFSLVISLLLVTMGGLYLLHMEMLALVLILGSAVLLARVDLLRVRVVPSPLLLTLAMGLLVLGGLNLGRLVGPAVVSRLRPPQVRPLPLRPWPIPPASETPEPPEAPNPLAPLPFRAPAVGEPAP
ncbi:MAG: hypothetical protein ACKOBY_06740 [Cyanobium sp.]